MYIIHTAANKKNWMGRRQKHLSVDFFFIKKKSENQYTEKFIILFQFSNAMCLLSHFFRLFFKFSNFAINN